MDDTREDVKWLQKERMWDKNGKCFSNTALKNLMFPIIVEQFLALLAGIADTLMVSHVGEADVSAVSLVSQLNNVFIMVFTALASGGAVVAGQPAMLTGLISIVMTGIVLGFGKGGREV